MFKRLMFLMIFLSGVYTNLYSNKTPYTEVLDSPLVINLSRHAFRYETTKKLMEEAGFTNITRFEAIDGFYTSDDFFKELNIIHTGPGIKGCAASHLVIWREFFQNPDSKEFLFVCEDDMLPHSQFAELFPLYWENTPDDFNIVFVGNTIQENKLSDDLVVKCNTLLTHAYIISKKGAKKLYDLYMKIPEDNKGLHVIDIFLNNSCRHNKIDGYYCFNGKKYPDLINQQRGVIKKNSRGLCFQNKSLGTSIHSVQIKGAK